jgi:hypothetical protein
MESIIILINEFDQRMAGRGFRIDRDFRKVKVFREEEFKAARASVGDPV